jgi:hypothetical protein
MKKFYTLIILLFLPVLLFPAEAMNILLIPASVETAYRPLPERIHKASRFELLYSQWLYGAQSSSFGWQNNHTLLQARFLQSGGIEIRGQQPVNEPVATTDYLSGLLKYGLWLDKADWQFFATAYLLYERLWYASSFGIATDLAFSKNISKNLQFNGGLKHLGQMNALDDNATPLPMRAFGGLDYSQKPFAFSAYGQLNRHQDLGAILFGRVNILDSAELNASFSSYEKAFMAGASLFVKEWTLGLSFIWFQENLQIPLLFSAQR